MKNAAVRFWDDLTLHFLGIYGRKKKETKIRYSLSEPLKINKHIGSSGTKLTQNTV